MRGIYLAATGLVLSLMSMSPASAQCVVNIADQYVTTYEVPFKVIHDGGQENRKAVYKVLIGIQRCEVGGASPIDSRFCEWSQRVYAIRTIKTAVFGRNSADIEDSDYEILIDTNVRRASSMPRFDGSAQNCVSQQGAANVEDERMRQVGRENIEDVAAADRARVENFHSSEDGFIALEW